MVLSGSCSVDSEVSHAEASDAKNKILMLIMAVLYFFVSVGLTFIGV